MDCVWCGAGVLVVLAGGEYGGGGATGNGQ